MPLLSDDFRPAAGLSDGHAQTIFGKVARRPLALPTRRERLTTPDGDFVDVDVLQAQAGAPTVLVLHGLESSSQAGYVQHTVRCLAERGWGAVALNFRGCSDAPNVQAKSYSSGDTTDARWLLSRLPSPKAAVGFSLGASVLVNLLAQDGEKAGLFAAAAVCTPFDLAFGARFLDSQERFARVYLANFLPTLKEKALEKARRFPALLDAGAIARTRTIRDFDHVVTARLFGFSSAEDYYAQCSTGPKLTRLTVPTLLVSAEDDALAPAANLPEGAHLRDALHVLRTTAGGHVGYVAGSVLRPRFWVEERVVDWLAERFRSP
ncbi:MAG: alpha/beta fold hydrolase [Myxococcota bacterium]